MKTHRTSFGAAAALLLAPLAASAAPDPGVLQKLIGNYDPQIQIVSKPAGHSFEGCPLDDVSLQGKDPVDGGDSTVTLKEYAARGGAPGRTILVMPPTGGENVIDRGWANYFCTHGFRVLLVDHWTHDDFTSLDPIMHEDGAIRADAGVRHVVEYAERSGAGSIGILGDSLGALTSALVLEVDARLRSGVLIVAGVGMSEIIARSNETHLTALREERMKADGYTTVDEYQAALAKVVRTDPKDFVGFSGSKHVLAVVALKDLTVPTANQQELVKDFKPEPVIEVDTDHLGAIKSAFFSHRGTILEFFQKTL